MNKKQTVAVIVTCIILVFTGLLGVSSAKRINSLNEKAATNTKEIVNDFIFNSTGNKIETPDKDYIGQLNIIGTIQESSATSYLYPTEEYDHKYNMEFVDKMILDDKNKGIFLNVDSPGGTVYHSDEMYLKLMEYKEKTNRPIYAYFGSYACSGAYYISMAADKIYANRNTWTGSIGVIISMYNYKELLDKLGVKSVDIVSGNNKNIGSGAVEFSEEHQAIFQSMVDESFDQFVEIVCDGRKLSEEKVRKLADGRIYTAKQALSNKLIDQISSQEDCMDEIKKETGCEDIFLKEKKNSLYSWLYDFSKINKNSTDSDIKAAMEMMENDNNGVLMYYAR